MLLLDEPTAGVAQREAEAFGPLVSSLRKELDATVVIIEHDIPLVSSMSDRLYCLALGEVIAEGTPDEVRDNPAVVAAYLGTDERAISRSGAATATSPVRQARRTPQAGPVEGGRLMSTGPARRWQLTPGQRYSSAITLIIAAALMTGLGNLHGVTGNDLAGPPLELAPVAAVPDVVPTAGGPTSTPSPDARVPLPAGNVPVFPPYDTGAVPSPRAFPLSPPAPKPTVAPTTPPPGNPSPTPTPSPCAAAPVNDSAKDALTTLNGPLGGQIPQDDILAALGLVTGCAPPTRPSWRSGS